MMEEVQLFQLLMVKVVDLHIQKKNVENLFQFVNIPLKTNRNALIIHTIKYLPLFFSISTDKNNTPEINGYITTSFFYE